MSVILKDDIAADLKPTPSGGITFYPASELGRICEWLQAKGRTLEWVEGLFYDPKTGAGELTTAYIRTRNGAAVAEFRAGCLQAAKALIDEAAAKSMVGVFEIGVSD